MVGLYETAVDALCSRVIDGRQVGPKIIASTATVRRAEEQIRALFGRAPTLSTAARPTAADSYGWTNRGRVATSRTSSCGANVASSAA